MLSDNFIRLRALEVEDLDMLYLWENDTSLWHYGNNIAPFSRKLLIDYINNYDGDIFSSQQLRLMIVPVGADTPVGMIDLYDFDAINRRAGIGIMIDAAHQSRGYARSALSLLCRYCYQRLGMHQLYATIAVDNTPSIALFQSCKFKISGKLRSWSRQGESYVDAYILQRLLTGEIMAEQ
ncbi:MAG: GNAT family N-acetyltransferase [Muribaculaceae bacterium]|nr:GNAT family N-acetyltransferase [Muribaculaceae bacterium]